MYHKIKTYMEEHGMIEAGDMVCAGVSGGGDSMAMLSALKRYQEEIPFSTVCSSCKPRYPWGRGNAG